VIDEDDEVDDVDNDVVIRNKSKRGPLVIDDDDDDVDDAVEDVDTGPTTAYLFINGHSCVFKFKDVNKPSGKIIIKQTQAPYGCGNWITNNTNKNVYNDLLTHFEYLSTNFEETCNNEDVSHSDYTRNYLSNASALKPNKPTIPTYRDKQYTIDRIDYEHRNLSASHQMPHNAKVCSILTGETFHEREFAIYENDNTKNNNDIYNGVFLGVKETNTGVDTWHIYNLLRKNRYKVNKGRYIYGLHTLTSRYGLSRWFNSTIKPTYWKDDNIGTYYLMLNYTVIFQLLGLLPFHTYKILDLSCVESCRPHKERISMGDFDYSGTKAYGKRYTKKNKKHFKKNMKKSRVKNKFIKYGKLPNNIGM